MDEVAESAAHTPFATIKTTTGLAEIGDWREFAVDRAPGIPARVEAIAGLLRIFFVLESNVYVADEMIIVVVADDNLLDQTILAELAPDVLIERVEVVLKLGSVHLVVGKEGWVQVEVG